MYPVRKKFLSTKKSPLTKANVLDQFLAFYQRQVAQECPENLFEGTKNSV
jgi:hypothetical protein